MGKLSRRLQHLKGPAGAPPPGPDDETEATVRRRRARLAALEGALASMVKRAGVEVTLPPARRREPPAVACEERSELRPFDARIGAIRIARLHRVDRRLLAQLALTPALEGCAIDRALYLDTETTGLGGGTGNLAFLVGVAYAEPGGVRLEQLFLRDPGGEPKLLARIADLVEGASVIVSFNGKSFDMPVLRARFVMNGMTPPPERPHLDLLHLARRVHKGRGWRKTLGIIEREVLGFRRGPDVGGEEVAQRYRHYLRTGDDVGLEEIVTHNAHDVWSLVGLTAFYGEPLEREPHHGALEAVGAGERDRGALEAVGAGERDRGALEAVGGGASPSRVPGPRRLDADDLPWAARTVRRAGDLTRAAELAELAVARGGGIEALRARAEIAKAARDLDRALAAFEEVAATASDPFVRLELAKLYEHHARDPARALAMVERGIAETEAARERRRRRLMAKLGPPRPRRGG